MTKTAKGTTRPKPALRGGRNHASTKGSGPLPPLPPHSVIAARAGMHRSTITRILSNNPEQWRLRSALAKTRRVAAACNMTVEQFMRHLGV